MDIAENSINGGATKIAIQLQDAAAEKMLTIKIEDNGRGMSRDLAQKALNPFYTSKEGKRIGLGLPLFRQAAEESGGSLTLETKPGGGTTVIACFKKDHPDCKPLGDIAGTVQLLTAFHPEIEILFDSEGGRGET